MGGQAIERREVMRLLAFASAAAHFPGFVRWSFGCGHASSLVQVTSASYRPLFFSPREYETIELLAELIIPNDGTPGAREAGVAEFIDFMVANDPEIAPRFRFGLAWLDSHCIRLEGQPFRVLPAEKQTAILGPLAYRDRFRPREEAGRTFFRLMRDYTVMGFYTSRAGLEQLDYPGLSLHAESGRCAHPDDPEHRQRQSS
jgi:hypothetical protein